MDFLNLDGQSGTPSPMTSTNNNINSGNSPLSSAPDNNFDFTSFLNTGETNTASANIQFINSQTNTDNVSVKQENDIRASLSRALNSNVGKQVNSSSISDAGDDNSKSPASISSPPTTSGSASAPRPIIRNSLRPNSVSVSGTTPRLSTSMSRKSSLVAASPATSLTGPSGQPVDRKRRDNMNEKIQELLELIPKSFFEDSKDKSSGTKDGKPNKGQILSKSVDYINWLQAQIDERNRKEVELSIKLRNLEISNNVPVSKRMNLLHTSAEIGLSRIGVGPLAEQQD
ncbi:unnamed protein product [Ambrosiozyma monospora]|uniref:Unnamed protein product n=1 Tax=Ambrosiozyma monospora TaxID=43982 RepID=A0A9W7DI76_AMBMO|nr:unnamed protein product [Ambrosiozyma monospora]